MKKILYVFTIIIIFLISPKVYASTVNGLPLSFGNGVTGYNWASSTSYTNLPITWNGGENLTYYFTNNTVSTGTNGISFAVKLDNVLLPNHYYRLVYIVGNGMEQACGAPASWANQLRFSYTNTNSMTNTLTYDRTGTSVGSIDYYVGGSSSYNIKMCGYFHLIRITDTQNRSAVFANLPVNSNGNINTLWYFYGYYLEDLGSADALTAEDLQNSITDLQNSLTQNNNTNTQNIINNQNQNAQQAHNDAVNTQNTIKDDNVNSNTGKSFFDGFSDNTHGLSGIITAPLNIIQSLINVNPTSCSDLSTTYHGKTISMKCGSIFWGHTGFSEFNVFYNMVVGGAFCYLIIKDLFITIEKMKDPDNDKVEVMDL